MNTSVFEATSFGEVALSAPAATISSTAARNDIVHHEGIPRLEKIPCHGSPHDSQTDKAYFLHSLAFLS